MKSRHRKNKSLVNEHSKSNTYTHHRSFSFNRYIPSHAATCRRTASIYITTAIKIKIHLQILPRFRCRPSSTGRSNSKKYKSNRTRSNLTRKRRDLVQKIRRQTQGRTRRRIKSIEIRAPMNEAISPIGKAAMKC